MVGPINALGAGAARLGTGDLSQRIVIRTGDELELLANQFNQMAARLEESYAGLESKVAQRTVELADALAQQTAIADVLRLLSRSPTDAQPVLQLIAAHAARTHCLARRCFPTPRIC
jgi:nitrate/nitrite-specific signal transduction histidine kinase